MAEVDKLKQLEQLRSLALQDANHYPNIVPNILSFIAPGNDLAQRRFGADFLAETFATPALPDDKKQIIALKAIETLRQFLETHGEDAAVVKSVVQAATSIYPLIFHHIIYNPTDNATWMHMAAIKSNILRRMDSSPAGVKVCCIKFIQRVVQVQTPGQISHPSPSQKNEISLALVPPGHPLISPQSLEPEASGLLDRLLSIFQDAPSDAIYITATLNCAGILLRTRPIIANRVLDAILRFDPFRLAAKGILTPRDRILAKSIERTLRSFLKSCIARIPGQPWQGRVQGHLDRLQQARAEIFDESRKRSAPVEPTDGLDNAKRQRLDANLSTPTPPMNQIGKPPGPMTLAQIFTLTQDPTMIKDVSQTAKPALDRIIEPLLRNVDRQKLDIAINTVRARWLALSQLQQQVPLPTGPPQPAAAQTTQVMNQMGHAPAEVPPIEAPAELNLGPLVIPQPPPLAPTQVATYGKATLDRVLSTVSSLESTKTVKKPQGFNRLAASSHDRDAWATLVTRLATRTTTGLVDNDANSAKKEEEGASSNEFSLGDNIREGLLKYILTDFRKRINVAISWLNEEWYNDMLQTTRRSPSLPNYNKWALRVLDGLLPYLDANDTLIVRFMSEIQAINPDMLDRINRLAEDPERLALAIKVLIYLIFFRPPVREMCLDVLERIYKDNPAARAPVDKAKVLQKWRPSAVEVKQEADVKMDGVAAAAASPAPEKQAAVA